VLGVSKDPSFTRNATGFPQKLYDLFNLARRSGLLPSKRIEDPQEQVFSAIRDYEDHHVANFIATDADGISGPWNLRHRPDDELDMDVHHHDASQPVAALNTMADSLPVWELCRSAGRGDHYGLWEATGGDRSQSGRPRWSAPFLGILLLLWIMGPIAEHMSKWRTRALHYYVLRVAMASEGVLYSGSGVCRRAVPAMCGPNSRNWNSYAATKWPRDCRPADAPPRIATPWRNGPSSYQEKVAHAATRRCLEGAYAISSPP